MPAHLKRYQTEGHEHFITFSCYGRKPYLNNNPARITFEQTLERLRIRHQFYLFGYVIMPEHVHLLMTEPQLETLSTTLGVLKNAVAKRHKGNSTHFWQTRYFDFNVLTDRKHIEKLRYIHRNPVKRGLVKKPEDWPWSSFHHHLTGERGLIEIESEWTWNRRHNPTINEPS